MGENGNATKITRASVGAVGAVLVGMATVFAFMNGVPWDAKGAAAGVKVDVRRELDEFKGLVRDDLQEIKRDVRKLLERGPVR
mgnify:CR=1 FL=1